jgi:uncharacterized membrane protein YjfL (UPF0719 family)
LGQAILFVAHLLFNKLCACHKEAISASNTSAGISFGGFMAATGLCVGAMSQGNLTLNATDVSYFLGLSVVSVVVLLSLRHTLFDWIFAGGTSLSKEIYEDKNSAAGWIVAFASIGLAQLFVQLFISHSL